MWKVYATATIKKMNCLPFANRTIEYGKKLAHKKFVQSKKTIQSQTILSRFNEAFKLNATRPYDWCQCGSKYSQVLLVSTVTSATETRPNKCNSWSFQSRRGICLFVYLGLSMVLYCSTMNHVNCDIFSSTAHIQSLMHL